MIVIILNGVTLPPSEVKGEDGVSITTTVSDNETGSQTKKVSAELTFYGAAWATLKAALIDPVDGRLQKVSCKVYDDCCTPPLLLCDGCVKGDSVGWCEDECYCTGHITEDTADTEAAACLKNTLIFDNWNGFQEQAHPRMGYCDELRPHWLHHTILILGIILLLALTVLVPLVIVITVIITVINAIIAVVNTLPGVNIGEIDFDGNSSTTFLEEYNDMRQRLVASIIGCGRVHPSPFLRSYIANGCEKCGLQFQSSILTNASSDYFNTVLWSAPIERGTRDDNDLWLHKNRPVETVDTLMDKLCPVFNARRAIIDGVLHMERWDKMPGGTFWVDPQVLTDEGRITEGVCYKWSTENMPSFLEIGFYKDGIDCVGDEAIELYQDIVEWNNPYNSAQTGSEQRAFQYGMVRCRRDGEGSDILDSYSAFDGLFFGGQIADSAEAMLLERGIATLPKLLIAEQGPNYWKVRKFNVPGYFKAPDENYNFPYHFNEFNVAPNTPYEPDTANMGIYGRFHALDNPKVTAVRGLDFTFEFEYTCSELQSLNVFALIPTPYGDGVITEVTINISKRTILVAGKV